MRSLTRLPSKPALAATLLALFLLTVAPAPAQDGPGGQLTAEHLESLQWRNIGPAISSGRIVDIAVDPSDTKIVYVASASGGLWKSTNHGTTWEPVFDHETTISLGAVAVAPSNPNVIWVGTGEANNQRSSSWGDGVYKSQDGGKSWQHMGLETSQHVGAFAIHPDNEQIVYVAALGALWGPNPERGLYRTVDGGKSWELVLAISEHTGVVDVVMDPRNPDRLYAAAYQRERRNWSFLGGGPEGGIYRSEDGGDSWEKLDSGLPETDIGKIGFAISPSDPDIVYAILEAQKRGETGVYRSSDRGASWEHLDSSNPIPWYYSQIRVDPKDADRVYVLGTRLSVSDDGGRTFRNDGAPGIHVDHHALWIDPRDPDQMILGNDGGLAFTYDRGASWDFVANLPLTQYYHIAADMREPFYTVYGGTQDNNTWGGPSGTRNSDGIVNDDWYITVGGDGFYAQVDPTDDSIVYSESQYGNLVRFDTRTGERKFIQPRPPEDEHYRWNWAAPLLISPHDHNTLYFAANKLFRSRDRGDAWEVISDDLSRQLDRDELEMMGRNWPKDAVSRHSGVSEYGNVTTFDESPLRVGYLAAGTDDGLINISLDGGDTWNRVDSFEGVPEMTRVSRLIWSRHQENRLYVVFDGHKDNNFRPYVLRSNDHGESFESITSNMPEYGSTRVIREHPRNPDLLAVGTEFGVFLTIDAGESWVQLKNNLPTVAVHDILFHPRENDLIIGTHGRGIWILDDVAMLEEMSAALESSAYLARVREAMQYNTFNRGRGAQGARYYRAPNPPRGAILTYYLDKEALQAPEGESPPKVGLEIVDAAGAVIRKLETSSTPGVHRAVWDLRHEPPYRGEEPEPQAGRFGGGTPLGPLVIPSTYTARLTLGDIVHEQPVMVVPDPLVQMSDSERQARHDTLLHLSHLQATIHAAMTTAQQLQGQLETITQAIADTPGAPEEVAEQAKSLSESVDKALTELRGASGFPPDPSVPVGISRLINRLAGSISGYTAAPSAAELDVLSDAQKRLASVASTLNELAGKRLSELNAALDAAGVRWTPGRDIRLREQG